MKDPYLATRSFIKKSPIYQYLAMVTGTLVILSSGMNTGWPSISLPTLLRENSTIPTTSDEGSWMAVINFIGGLPGNYIGSLLIDRIGRKNVLLLTTIPSFVGWMIIAFIPSTAAILAARFINGMSDGASFCILPLYLAEISDSKRRGFIGSSVVATRIFGTMLINVIGVYLDISQTAMVCSAIPVVCLLTFWWVPESPYYYLIKQNLDHARRSLVIFRGTDHVDDELNRMNEAVKEQQKNSGRCLDLLAVKGNRKALIVSLITFGAQQFSGTTALTNYAQTIFDSAGDALSPNAATMIYFSVQLAVCMCCSVIVDKVGRKPLLLISMAGSGLALLIDAIYFLLKEVTTVNTTKFDFVPIVALVIYVVVFGLGMQTLPILILGEIFPTNVKAFASALANIYFCILAALVSKLFQITKDAFGMNVPFFFFTAVCFLGLLLTVIFVPETKGKTLEEIQEELQGRKNKTAISSEAPSNFRKVTEF